MANMILITPTDKEKGNYDSHGLMFLLVHKMYGAKEMSYFGARRLVDYDTLGKFLLVCVV